MSRQNSGQQLNRKGNNNVRRIALPSQMIGSEKIKNIRTLL